ncbi:hypothetical protein Y032_0089g2315 [Ancylostoma ceylanicum]|nr:hypothetical protein Y032_0089g2315 [Ancylostoma ceylanicum]
MIKDSQISSSSRKAIKLVLIKVEPGAERMSELVEWSIDEPLSLPLPYELTETSLASLPAIAWACTLENPRLVYHLKAAGADLNAVDLEGRTPLMIALLANRAAAVHALCGDGSMQHNKPAAKKIAKSKSTRLMLGTLLGKGRKRKASEDENEERAESEDGSEHYAESAGSGSEVEEQEAEGEEQERRTPPPKKIKICNKKLDFMLADRKGRNIIHYMVEPIQWENVELLQQLHKEAPVKIKQLLQQKNKEGNTPLDIAVKTNQRNIAAAMKAILGTPAKEAKITNDEGVLDLPDVSGLACKYNVDEDSEMYIEQWRVENEIDSEPETPKPSSMSGYSETADLVRCPVTQQFMAAVLNKTDLNYGRYGFHNFYRIELMKRRDTDLWILFTNWGRIGQGVGEYQTTPFNSIDAALKEFKSIWRSKTGQDWGPLDKFQSLPKKYRLVQTTKRLRNMPDIHLPYKETKEEDLVRRTIQDISNPEKLKDFANQINWNVSCPFGHITEAAIERARYVLDKCEQNVQDLEKTLEEEGHTDMDVLKIFEKILMKRRDTDLWILFTNWGRIGQGVGEYQTTPFNSIDAALKEFKSIWRSKTGQDWGPLDKFQSLPKKYRLVQTTKRLRNMPDIHLPYKETKEEDLVRRTIQDISNPEKLKDFANQVLSELTV